LESSTDADESRLLPGGSALIKAPKINPNEVKLGKERENAFLLHDVDKETPDAFVDRMIQLMHTLSSTRPAFDQVLAGSVRTVLRLNQAASSKRNRRFIKVTPPFF